MLAEKLTVGCLVNKVLTTYGSREFRSSEATEQLQQSDQHLNA
jgi:hypothetical protein